MYVSHVPMFKNKPMNTQIANTRHAIEGVCPRSGDCSAEREAAPRSKVYLALTRKYFLLSLALSLQMQAQKIPAQTIKFRKEINACGF